MPKEKLKEKGAYPPFFWGRSPWSTWWSSSSSIPWGPGPRRTTSPWTPTTSFTKPKSDGSSSPKSFEGALRTDSCVCQQVTCWQPRGLSLHFRKIEDGVLFGVSPRNLRKQAGQRKNPATQDELRGFLWKGKVRLCWFSY